MYKQGKERKGKGTLHLVWGPNASERLSVLIRNFNRTKHGKYPIMFTPSNRLNDSKIDTLQTDEGRATNAFFIKNAAQILEEVRETERFLAGKKRPDGKSVIYDSMKGSDGKDTGMEVLIDGIVICINEADLLKDDVVQVIRELINKGVIVYAAGQNLDHLRNACDDVVEHFAISNSLTQLERTVKHREL